MDYLVLAQFFDLAPDLGLKDLLDLEASPPNSSTSLVQSSSQGVCERSSSTSEVQVLNKSSAVSASAPITAIASLTLSELVDHDYPSSSAPSAPPSSELAENHSSSSAAKVSSPDDSCPADGSGPSTSAASSASPLPEEPEQQMTVVAAVRICPVCLKKVKSKSYKRHMLKHDSQIPTCHLCGKQFGRKDNLARHLSARCSRCTIT